MKPNGSASPEANQPERSISIKTKRGETIVLAVNLNTMCNLQEVFGEHEDLETVLSKLRRDDEAPKTIVPTVGPLGEIVISEPKEFSIPWRTLRKLLRCLVDEEQIPTDHDIGRRFEMDDIAILMPALTKLFGGSSDPRSLAPFVPTPENVALRMMAVASPLDCSHGMRMDSIFLDPACGDGRTLELALRHGSPHAYGFELDHARAEKARVRLASKYGPNLWTIKESDGAEADFSRVETIFLYLTTSGNEKIREKLEAQCKPGTRIVSNTFTFVGWTPYHTESVQAEGRRWTFYAYEIGKHKLELIAQTQDAEQQATA